MGKSTPIKMLGTILFCSSIFLFFYSLLSSAGYFIVIVLRWARRFATNFISLHLIEIHLSRLSTSTVRQHVIARAYGQQSSWLQHVRCVTVLFNRRRRAVSCNRAMCVVAYTGPCVCVLCRNGLVSFLFSGQWSLWIIVNCSVLEEEVVVLTAIVIIRLSVSLYLLLLL